MVAPSPSDHIDRCLESPRARTRSRIGRSRTDSPRTEQDGGRPGNEGGLLHFRAMTPEVASVVAESEPRPPARSTDRRIRHFQEGDRQGNEGEFAPEAAVVAESEPQPPVPPTERRIRHLRAQSAPVERCPLPARQVRRTAWCPRSCTRPDRPRRPRLEWCPRPYVERNPSRRLAPPSSHRRRVR